VQFQTRNPEPDPATVHWPSIRTQTPWQVGVFGFGKAEAPDKVAYFNPGLVERADGLWLVARRSENRPGISIGMNSLMAFKLDGHLAPMYGVPIKMLPRFPGEHFEDARVVQRHDTTWVSCSNFIVFPRKPKELWTGSQIAVCPVNERWEATDRIDPVYGNNAKQARGGNDIEKNWLWFWPGASNAPNNAGDGGPHLVYSASGGEHRVVRFTNGLRCRRNGGRGSSRTGSGAWYGAGRRRCASGASIGRSSTAACRWRRSIGAGTTWAHTRLRRSRRGA